MDSKEIRRQNMLALAEEHGGLQGLADLTDTDAKYLSQVKNLWRRPNGAVSSMGADVARRIEEKLSKPYGWMDVVHHVVAEPLANYAPHPPVVGTVQLGDDGYWHELEYPVGHGEGFVRYPTKDANTYALRVKGDSMRPRIKPGEFVVIEPNAAFGPGDEVMVQTKDGRSMIKQLGSRRDGLIELLSVNEDHKPITLEEKDVEKIHHVGGILKSNFYYES